MTEQVLSDLYMVDGGADNDDEVDEVDGGDVVDSPDSKGDYKYGKKTLMVMQVCLIILILCLIYNLGTLFMTWYKNKYGKHNSHSHGSSHHGKHILSGSTYPGTHILSGSTHRGKDILSGSTYHPRTSYY